MYNRLYRFVCQYLLELKTQAVADAYYVLSDPTRRKEYDSLYGARKEKASDPNASASFFSAFANMFGGGQASGATPPGRPDADGVFADVFEEVCITTVTALCTFPYLKSPGSYYDQKFNDMPLGGHGLELHAEEA